MAKVTRMPSENSYKATVAQKELATRFENMLKSVADMLDADGPIYSTWIYFQIGLNGKAITFNSSSIDTKENLIAQLDIEKNGSGVANSFTLTIKYDPFNMGQNPTDEIEALDEFIALAMEEDFKDDSSKMRGYLQYGYNSTTETNLVSPLYTFMIVSASSNVTFDSGITTYTFEGTSTLSADCDFVTLYEGLSKPKKSLEIVEETLYRYYGDPENPPKHISGIEPIDNEYKYRIDIPDELYNDCIELQPEDLASSKSNMMSPFAFVKWLLDEHPLTASEAESGKYNDYASLSYNQRPRYTLYVSDSEPKTIRITHFAPGSHKDSSGTEVYAETGLMKIDYVFSWGRKNQDMKNKNIVIGWTPQVDLYTYLIRKALKNRHTKLNELYLESLQNRSMPYFLQPFKDVLIKIFEKYCESIQDEVMEQYNAELQIVGIPTDAPIGAEVEIHPQILESESRTRGIYAITGAVDSINNQGVFVTTLKLFRKRSTDAIVEKPLTEEQLAALKNVGSAVGNLVTDAASKLWDTITNINFKQTGSSEQYNPGYNDKYGQGGGSW